MHQLIPLFKNESCTLRQDNTFSKENNSHGWDQWPCEEKLLRGLKHSIELLSHFALFFFRSFVNDLLKRQNSNLYCCYQSAGAVSFDLRRTDEPAWPSPAQLDVQELWITMAKVHSSSAKPALLCHMHCCVNRWGIDSQICGASRESSPSTIVSRLLFWSYFSCQNTSRGVFHGLITSYVQRNELYVKLVARTTAEHCPFIPEDHNLAAIFTFGPVVPSYNRFK
jgi:hypothetical protein